MSRFKAGRDKVRSRVRILPLLLSFQMFVPTHLMAQTEEQATQDNWADAAKTLKAINELGQTFVQQHQLRLQSQQAQASASQLEQSLGIQPVDPSQVPPILAQNGCFVLQARTDQISSGLSCSAPLDDALFNQGHYDALLSVAEKNVNTLENYLTAGHERYTTQGIGCYEKAKNQLNTQLLAREEMLSQMKESLEKRIEVFKKLAEDDLDQIKKGDILLNGTGSNSLTGESREKYANALKDINFEDKFNDPQCKSLFSNNQFSDFGQKGGLRGIEQTLANNSEELGAENFFAKQKQYETEIRKIADEAYKKARDAKTINVSPSDTLGGIRTREFSTNADSLVQSFSIAATKAKNNLDNMQKDLSKALGDEPELSSIVQSIESDSVDIDQVLYDWEKKEKNSCMNNHIANEFGGIQGFVGKLNDPNISAKANREADSAFKNYVTKILSDDRYTVEEKMEKIADAQQSSGTRYGFVSDKSFTIKGQQVGASTRLRASDLVTLLAQDCREEFEQDARTGGYSASEKIKALKSYATKFEVSQEEFASNLKTEIIEGMISCPDDTSTGSGAGTCGTNSTDLNGPGFCVRTANACASNALACVDKAKKIVEETRKSQQVVAARYKSNMDKLKNDLITEFEMVSKSLETSSRTIDSLYQMGTQYKKEDSNGMELALNFTDTELLAGVDPSLALEDPDKYEAKIMANIDQVKDQLAQHRQEVTAAFTKEIEEKYVSNYKKQREQWNGVISQCTSAINQKIVQLEQAKQKALESATAANQKESEKAKESNEKIMEACNKYADFRVNPCPGGSGSEFGSLANDIAAIATSSADTAAAQDIRSIVLSCDSFGNESGGNLYGNLGSGGGKNTNDYSQMSLSSFCGEGGGGADLRVCQKLERLRPAYEGYVRSIASGNSNVCNDTTHLPIGFQKMNESGSFCRIRTSARTEYEYIKEPSCENIQASQDASVTKMTSYHNIQNQGLKDRMRQESNCSTKSTDSKVVDMYEKAEEEASEVLAQYKRQKFNSKVGEIKVAACESGVDSEPGMPDMFNSGNARPGNQKPDGTQTFGF
ncbi:MAG: hypothetical protein KC478_03665 [Bacteriovoracaceae bacterium]|nr:hypothetical protein [Bacteriovoracaceae bacterium]